MANIVRYTPQNWIDDLWSSRLPGWMSEIGRNTAVQADMWEQNNAVHVKMALPDMEPGDVDIGVKDGILTIKAMKKNEKEDKSGKQYFYQSMQTSIEHSFSLPYDVEISKSDAKLEKGVLHLTLPKSGKSSEHKIAIQTS